MNSGLQTTKILLILETNSSYTKVMWMALGGLALLMLGLQLSVSLNARLVNSARRALTWATQNPTRATTLTHLDLLIVLDEIDQSSARIATISQDLETKPLKILSSVNYLPLTETKPFFPRTTTRTSLFFSSETRQDLTAFGGVFQVNP